VRLKAPARSRGRFGQLRRERPLAGVGPCARHVRSGAGGAAGAPLLISSRWRVSALVSAGARAASARAWTPHRVRAALARPAGARLQHASDDRLETRAYAVKRYLFRLGHAARSGRYACSVEQLVIGLAPVMGWGAVPVGGSEGARFVRAHRKSVQRWLDDLQAAGVVAHEPERDERGWWWRTQIVLLTAPAPNAEELRIAQRRALGWRARERARRRQHRRACALATIRSRASQPRQRTRSRLARARARAAHEARRRALVEAQIETGRAVAQARGVLTHPFGAPPTSADARECSKRDQRAQTPQDWAPAAARSAQTLNMAPTFAAGTGAHVRAASGGALTATPPGPEQRIQEIGRMQPEEFEVLVLRRVADRERQLAVRTALRREHVVVDRLHRGANASRGRHRRPDRRRRTAGRAIICLACQAITVPSRAASSSGPTWALWCLTPWARCSRSSARGTRGVGSCLRVVSLGGGAGRGGSPRAWGGDWHRLGPGAAAR